MRNQKLQKILSSFTLSIYFITLLLQSFQYFLLPDNKARADEVIAKTTDVVAIFVDQDIYNKETSNIQWYAQNYIQTKMPGTVALVFPVPKTIAAWDIAKGLDNLYFEGLQGASSSLKGVILIGDLPLPVVDYNNGYFPTVYPYTDFVNKKYVYNPDTKFFEYTKISDAHPEIWHSLINLGTDQANYDSFFSKLKNYDTDPNNFVTKKIYYDDFIDAKQKFNALALKDYINKMLFSDDITNHRYSNMMLDFLSNDANGNSLNELENLGQDVKNLDLSGNITKLNFDTGAQKIQNTDSKHVPTKLINQSVDDLLKEFKDVVGQSYLVNKRDNIAAGGRYYPSEIDGFDSNIDKLDETSKSLIDKLNSDYEEKIDQYAKLYQTNIIVPSSYKDKNLYYENYLFGTNAKDITTAKNLSYYRGTYNESYDLASLENSSIKNVDKNFSGQNNDYSNPEAKSVGNSMGLFNTLVAYNRLYNFDDEVMYGDFEDFSGSDCKEKDAPQPEASSSSSQSSMSDEEQAQLKEAQAMESMAGMLSWAMRIYGGGSPLAYSYTKDDSMNGFYFKNAIKPLLDIGGAKKVVKDLASQIDKENGTTYLAGKLYSNLIYSGTQSTKCKKTLIHESWQNAANTPLSAFDRIQLEQQKKPVVDTSGKEGNPLIWIQKGRYGGDDQLPFYGTSFNMFDYPYSQPDKDFSKWEFAIDTGDKLPSIINNIGFFFSGNTQPILSADPTTKLQFTGDNFEDLETYVTGDIKFYTGLVLAWKKEVFSGDGKQYPLTTQNLQIWDKMGILASQILPQVKILQKNDSTGVVVGYTGAIVKNNFVKDFTGVAISLSGTNTTGGALSGTTLTTTGFVTLNEGYVIQNSGYAFVTTGYIFGRGLNGKKDPSALPSPQPGNQTYNRAGCLTVRTSKLASFFLGKCKESGDDQNGGMKTNTGDDVDLVYKTIPSIVKHNNPVESDVNQMNTLTPDRAIDSKKITFQGQNGNLVEWYYPNFFDVPVYKKENGIWKLKSEPEIETAVKEYVDAKTSALNKQILNDYAASTSGLFLTQDNCEKTFSTAQCKLIFTGGDQYFGLQKLGYGIKSFDQLSGDIKDLLNTKIWYLNKDAKNDFNLSYSPFSIKNCNISENSTNCTFVVSNSQLQNINSYLNTKFPNLNDQIVKDFAALPNFENNPLFQPITNGNFINIGSCQTYGSSIECGLSFSNYKKYLIYDTNKKNMMKFTPSDKKLLLNINPDLYVGTGLNQKIKLIQNSDMLNILSGGLGDLDTSGTVQSIAKALYQLNGGWENKVTDDSNVGNYFSGLKSTFATSEKVKYAVDQSIKVSASPYSGNNFIYPTHNATGYEVAFINSDGKDLLGDQSEIQGSDAAEGWAIVNGSTDKVTSWEQDTKNIDWAHISAKDALKLENISKKQSSILSDQINNSYTPVGRTVDEDCGIPPSGSVPLKKWVPAFNCWLRETTKAPFKATLNYSCSQGPVLKPGDLPKAENINLDLDNNIQLDIASGSTFTNDQFSANLPLNLNLSSTNLPQNSTANITFRAVSANKTNCLKYSNTLLCNRGSFDEISTPDMKNIPLNTNTSIPLYFNSSIPDDITLLAKIETKDASGNVVSTEKEVDISMIAGQIKSADIIIPTTNDSMIKGGQMPFTLDVRDSNGYKINMGFESLKIDTNIGTIISPSETSKSITTSSFGDSYILDTSEAQNSAANIPLVLTISKIGPDGTTTPISTKNLTLSDGELVANGQKAQNSTINIQLTGYDFYKTDNNGVVQFLTGVADQNGLKIDLGVVAAGTNKSLPTFATISSKNGLVKIGEANVVSGFNNGNWYNQTVFNEKEIFDIKNTKSIYILPTMKAGYDQLSISIDGMNSSTIDINIKPGIASKIVLKQLTEDHQVGKASKIGVQVTDQWNNPTSGSANILLSASESLDFAPKNPGSNRVSSKTISSSTTGFDIYPTASGKGYITALLQGPGAPIPGYTPDTIVNGEVIAGEYTLNQVPGFLTLKVGSNNWYTADAAVTPSSDNRIPREGLNAMYVNLFGGDWGNIFGYYTNTDPNMIKNLFKNSPKTLAITTQLVDPNNLKATNLSVDKNLHVINNANYNLSLEKNGNSYSLVVGDFPKLGTLPINNAHLTYQPGTLDSNITSNQINGTKILIKKNNIDYEVLDISNMKLGAETSLEFQQADKLTFDVKFNQKSIGKIIVDGTINIDPNNLPQLEQNKTVLGYSAGSTNSDKAYLFMGTQDISYIKTFKSIEDSIDTTQGIGFRNDFRNITNFAAGSDVGDATKFFASEFVINYGDPLISKVSNNPNLNQTTTFLDTGMKIDGINTGDSVVLKNYMGDLQLLTGGNEITLLNSGYDIKLQEFATGIDFFGSGVSFVPLSGSFKWYSLTTGSVKSKVLTGKTTLEMSGKQIINFANWNRDRNIYAGITYSGQAIFTGKDGKTQNTSGIVLNLFLKKQKLGDIYIMNSGFNYTQLENLNPENDDKSPTTGLDFDMSMGKEIYGGTKQIANVFPIDFNSDGQKDVAISFTDGSIKLLKNYQGEYNDLGELMLVGDGIKEIFAGKTTSSGQEDIFVRSNEDRIRIYKNSGGTFDVDGNPLCIDAAGFSGAAGEMKVDMIDQMITQDINNDGLLDIITNDKNGDITVFWGGSSASGDNYISSEKNKCDDGWKARSDAHKTVLHSFGLTLKSGDNLSSSIVRWPNLKNSSIENTADQITTEQANNQGNSELNSKMKEAQDAAEKRIDDEASAQSGGKCSWWNFACKIAQAITSVLGLSMKDKAKAMLYKTKYKDYLKEEQLKRGIDIMNPSASSGALTQSGVVSDIRKYIDIPIGYKASFDTDLTGSFVTYVDGRYLSGDKVLKLTQSFSGENGSGLKAGDIVTVTTKYESSSDFTLLEKLDGPFDVIMNGDKMYGMSGDFEKEIQSNYLNDKAILDTKNIPAGFIFKLDNIHSGIGQLQYKVRYRGVSPVTMKLKTIQLTGDKTGEEENFIRVTSLDTCIKDIWDYKSNGGTGFDETALELSGVIQEKVGKLTDTLEDNKTKVASGGSALVDVVGDSEDWTYNLKSNGRVDPSKVMNKFSSRLGSDYTKFQQGLCNGFSFGNSDCGGLPVPFNVSFLDPGMFNVMGYPVFFSPGMPIAWDYWMGPPQASQLFRLYASPTLTLGLGVSLCLGPYAAGVALPQPFAAIGGNCIVTAIKNPFMCSTPPQKAQPEKSVADWQEDLQDIGICQKTSEERETSPFEMNAPSTNPTNSTSPAGGTKITVDLKVVGGSIDISNVPMKTVAQVELKPIELQPGNPIVLKVQSGLTQGLVESIIKKWLDKQIQYIINNLTSMTVYMYLPDFNGLTKGLDKLTPGLQNTLKTIQDTKFSLAASTGTALSDKLPSKQALASISDAINNPFEQIGALFDETNLLKVKYNDVTLNVPFVYQEDLKKYQNYLDEYIKVNKQKIDDWTNILNNIKADANISASAKANFELKSNALQQYSKLLDQLKKNRDMLQQYAEFPFKLYDYVHVVDRYVYEISCIVKKFLEGTTGWLSDNSKRFEKWVNAAMLAIVALDSWQVLIDFTVQWKSKCGKCTVDNYDYHSFMLSLLNFDVPVIKIPSFRLPDVYLDFSKFDLGTTITLPRIKFVPQSVPLPKLPMLPDAPQISILAKMDANVKLNVVANLNINLPDIPVLPAPPKLPEIPSVIPTLELKLPTLPPAPEIPKLSTNIAGFVKVAGQIASIFLCIIKGQIGLVGESDVKTKVEQLTQRTRRLQPFDFLRLRVADPPVEGKDLKIESFVRLRADTDILYDFLNKQAKKINSFSSKAVNSYTNTINSASANAQNAVNNLNPVNTLSDNNSTQGSIADIFGTKNKPSTLSDKDYLAAIDTQISDIKKDLMSLDSQSQSPVLENQIAKLDTTLSTPRNIQANYEGMEKFNSKVETFFVNKIDENDKLLKKIQTDYTGFLNDISGPILVAGDTSEEDFSLKLFSASKQVEDTIKNQENPIKTYLDISKEHVDTINQALAKSDNIALDDRQLQQASSFFNDLGQKIDRLTTTGEQRSFAAPTPDPTTPASSSIKDDIADPTQGVVGIYMKNLSGDIVPGFGWTQKSKDMKDNNSYKFVDMNNDKKADILIWDDRSVSLKLAAQATGEYELQPINGKSTPVLIKKTIYKNYYKIDNFDPNTLTNWRSIASSSDNLNSIKLGDSSPVVNKFRRGSQDFENMNYLWDPVNPPVSGYLAQVRFRIDVGVDNLKGGTNIQDYSGENNEFYVFIVDKNSQVYNKNIILSQKDLINNSNTLPLDPNKVRIIPINMKDSGLSSVIEKSLNSQIGKNWAYIRMAPVIEKNGNFVQSAPWSAQAVGGTSVWDDEEAPILDLNILRNKDPKNGTTFLANGSNFVGYVNTNYTLSGTWSDNNMVVSNTEAKTDQNGNILDSSSTGSSNIDPIHIYQTTAGNYNYIFSAKDQNGNTTTHSITIQIKAPDISVDIQKNGDVMTPVVTLSHDIDAGILKFQKCSEDGTRCSNFSCAGEPVVEQGVVKYNAGSCSIDNIVNLYQSGTNIQFADVNAKSGQINPKQGKIALDFSDPMTNTASDGTTTPSDYNLVKVKVFSGDDIYGKVLITAGKINSIAPGTLKASNISNSNITTCLSSSPTTNIQDCEVVIGKNGIIATKQSNPGSFSGEYKFENGTITYTIKKDGTNAFVINFVPNPL